MSLAAIPFWEFCERVLRLQLTPGQRVVAKVAFGDYDPEDLDGEERELATELFGGLATVPSGCRRFVLLRLGRGSGKTTLCSAYSVYCAVTQTVKVGPGDTPYVITIAPDKDTAKLSISMAREMIRGQPALERLVVSDEKTSITLRRPEGLQVKIEAFAASRGGSSIRGRTILAFLLDEAEFFTSNSDDGRSYSVNDYDIFRALKPRLVRNGKGMMVSTPWPVETLMGTMFDRNWKHAEDGLAVLAPTTLVRGNDHDILAMVEDELKKDPDNARREFFCEIDGIMGDGFFDLATLTGATSTDDFPVKYNPLFPVVAACDFGFQRDSSAMVIVQYDGQKYHLVYAAEKQPKPGKPLKPSEVVKEFAMAAKAYGCTYVVSDGHYRESIKEHLASEGLGLSDAPTGMTGKLETYSRTRSVLHEGLVVLPKSDYTKQLIQQAKLVTSKALPGGGMAIKTPRKIGLGHGDMVSAWVLAVHRLAYSRVREEKRTMEPNTPDWHQEFLRKALVYETERNAKALKAEEKAVRSQMSARRYRMFTAAR